MNVSEAVINKREQTAGMQLSILSALSASYFANDMMQSLLLSIYPLLKGEFTLDFGQWGLITLTYQLTASLLQPLIGTGSSVFHPESSRVARFAYSIVSGSRECLTEIVLLNSPRRIYHQIYRRKISPERDGRQ